MEKQQKHPYGGKYDITPEEKKILLEKLQRKGRKGLTMKETNYLLFGGGIKSSGEKGPTITPEQKGKIKAVQDEEILYADTSEDDTIFGLDRNMVLIGGGVIGTALLLKILKR